MTFIQQQQEYIKQTASFSDTYVTFLGTLQLLAQHSTHIVQLDLSCMNDAYQLNGYITASFEFVQQNLLFCGSLMQVNCPCCATSITSSNTDQTLFLCDDHENQGLLHKDIFFSKTLACFHCDRAGNSGLRSKLSDNFSNQPC